MSEKGGDVEGSEEKKGISTNYVNSKIVATVAIAVIVGILFIFGMVFLGFQVSRNLNQDQPQNQPTVTPTDPEPVIESIEVDYEEISMKYTPDSDTNASYGNSLMHRYGVDSEEYAIIRTQSDLEDFVTIVNEMNKATDGSDLFSYEVDEEFFKTGTILAIAHEEAGLSAMSISDIHRDENYNLHIIGHYKTPYDTTQQFGRFSLIKIQNIQPKTVELVWNSEYVDPFPHGETEKKPIIYLYPTRTTIVNVKLGSPERITVDYPDYNNGWTVSAQPDGTLTTTSGKKLYALYYESKNIKDYSKQKFDEGFVVAKADVEEFLDQKLATLGLNYKEREEFISYWASELESKPFVQIRFQDRSEIDYNMSLKVSPQPDTVIRIMMEYKKLDSNIKVKAQKLPSVERKGFTVVEWGGTEVK